MKNIQWTLASRSRQLHPIIAIVSVVSGLPSVGDVIVCTETKRRYRVASLVSGMNYEAIKKGARGLTLEPFDRDAEDDLAVDMHLVHEQ